MKRLLQLCFAALGVVLLVASLVWLWPAQKPSAAHPNLVIITMDTTRADHLGAYGYFRNTTPRLDAFAESAMVFDRFIAPMSTTLPVHTSIFTGVWPDEHGIIANATFTGKRFVPTDQLVTLAEHLSGQGYQTAGFVSATPLKRDSGINAGFEAWSEPSSKQNDARETTLAALAHLRRMRGPVLLWVHYFDPHSDYHKQPLFNPTPDPTGVTEWAETRGASKVNIDNVDAYDAEIRRMDHWIGVLLAAVERWLDPHNTIIVVAGDHGEGFWQHDWARHGHIWNEQLWTPLMIRSPEMTPGHFDGVLSAPDVMPTALSLADFPTSGWLAQTSGSNVLDEAWTEHPVISRSSLRREQPRNETKHPPIPTQYSLSTSRWKYIRGDDGSQLLFDLEADPYELNDVADAHPQVCEELALQLTQTRARHARRAAQLGAGETEAASKATLEQLRALGYLEE